LRAYVTPTSTKTSASASIQARRYFSDPENYIGLKLGYGISPDDRRYGDRSSDYLTFKSQSVKLEYNHIFNKIWTTNIGATLSNEEYPVVGSVAHYSFEIGIGRFF
jgi:YaiO family outer membrane protein